MLKQFRLAVCLLLLVRPALAIQDAPGPTFIPPAPWQEQTSPLPAYPADADLLVFPVDLPGSAQTFAIDAKSLSLGSDRVVRYTAVITSASGARNVLYEGIRCEKREYRTYAYGTGGDAFRSADNEPWRDVNALGWGKFRAVLLEHFFCDDHWSPYRLNEIKRRLSHPQSVQ